LVAAAVFAWCVLSARLERADLTGPIVFTTIGVLLSALLPADHTVEPEAVKVLAEATLVWVLFADAARVGVRELRADASVYIRLLGLALPLTVVLGWLLASGLFDGLGVWLALLVGAALAPTDAALGAVVITHPAVPTRIRRILNVESGLNDGIVTPVVLVALAGAESGGVGGVRALTQLAIGTVVGVATGMAGGAALRLARRRGWLDAGFTGPAVLTLAVLAYTFSVFCHGNGFIAAFVGGIAFGHIVHRSEPQEVFFVEQTAGLASLLVWLVFGAIAVPFAVEYLSWQVLLYAVLSLTLVRMLPVALMLIGSGFDRRTVLFVGWFGPRGLASVIFALLAVEELAEHGGPAVAIIVTTVLVSVLAHGLSAGPLAVRYGAAVEPLVPDAQPVAATADPTGAIRLRRLLPSMRRHAHPEP
jgi:NhaP-type Na+/H+ or K+/H+ antiporter